MTLLLALLAGSLLSMLGFIAVDAKHAYDSDPQTHTLSMYLKQWKRKSKGHAAILSLLCFELAAVPFYLFVHLVLEVV